ncbi:MAG: SusC/RagA family TonB-linked outer membrane protein [Bacteroidales bacterium]|nr:SusC/RagA family TonB-linked outer membrane protein [Bacteroidales bacterium]
MGKKIFSVMLTLVLGMSMAFAQTRTVTGTVTSAEDGQPVVGASVFVKGATNVGVVTDLDGKFVLNGVPTSATTLVVSSIGMITKEVPVAAVVNVVLDADSEVLEEAVVTIAYGAAKKSTLTGAISQVNSESIQTRPASNVATVLEGSVSGVQVNSTYGAPGDDPSIRIRGFGTINGDASPLYVLDGVPFSGNVSDLNPADIESITVLKDAASAALYGNRASNGVILITSKKGSQGKLNMSIDVRQGTYSRGIPEYSRVNAKQWMNVAWANMYNQRIEAGKTPDEANAYVYEHLISDYVIQNIFSVKGNNNPTMQELFSTPGSLSADATIKDGYKNDMDWYKAAIRHGYRQEYNINANGANDKSDYYFSVGYLNEDGYVNNSGFERLTARAVINVKPVTWFKTGLNLFGSHQNYENTNGSSDGSYTNAFMYCRNIAPIYPIHVHDYLTGEYILDANGKKMYDGGEYIDADGNLHQTRAQYADRHVIWENELNSDRTVRNTLEAIAYAEFYLPYNFTLNITGNLNVRNSNNFTYNTAVIGDGKGSNGRGKRIDYRYKKYQLRQQLNWGQSFGDHTITALVAHESYYFNYDYAYFYKTNEIFPGSPNMSNFTVNVSMDGYQNNYRTESYLGRVRYNYKDKYNVEASFRRDGTSRFHKNSRWGNFWSIGANWMISKEDFMQGLTWINSLKLRADFGQVGNDSGAGYYGYMALYDNEQNANKGAYYIGQLENLDLKWETGQSWGVGIEARLFNRWNLNIEYFDRKNKDLLFDVPLPISAGATTTSGSPTASITRNAGSIANRGFEIETDIDIYRNRDWKVNFGANATFLRNKVTSLPKELNQNNGFTSGNKRIQVGKDRYAFYVYTFEGIDQMTGRSLYKFNDEDYFIKTTIDGVEKTFGNPEGTECTENYVIINGVPYSTNPSSQAKKEFHGSSIPKVYGGFNFNVSYKNFTANAVFTYALGGKLIDGVYANLMAQGKTAKSQHADILKSWSGVPAGMTETSANRIDRNGIPVINSDLNSYTHSTSSSQYLVSSNYLTLKNISVSYKLPKTIAKALTMQSITLSATCENLFVKAHRKGLDPQQSFAGSQSNYLVTPRVFSASLNIKF